MTDSNSTSETPPPQIPGDRQTRSIVVLDTDPGVRWSLEKGLSRSGYTVHTTTTVTQVLQVVHEQPIDAIIMELLPEAGLTFDALSTLVQSPNSPKLICISIDSRPQTVIECMRRGAGDFVLKPFSLAEVRGALGRALERDRGTVFGDRGKQTPGEDEPSLLIGVSPAIQDLRTIIRQAAQTDLNCLIRGDSGVGKDLVAREIHRLSERRDKPFVKVNCSALPENLLESELFGHEKGAFTGADTAKPGRFTLANKGIIFLDEIGDMHPFVQAKILQVIEHKEFTKLGGGTPVHVDVQIIAATNSNLEKKIASGAFRDDLYFRLNEVYIWAPSLSERKEDVPLLVRHFLRKHDHYRRKSAGNSEITGEDLEALTKYDWPGNVRELESTIKRWLALGRTSFLPGQSMVPSGDMAGVQLGSKGDAPGPQAPKAAAPAQLPEPEKVLEILERHQWNRRKTAQDMGISYPALRRFIERHDLDQQRSR